MADPRIQGPLSAVAVPLADALAQHAALPPFQKNVSRAAFGAGLLTLCGYAAVTFGPARHSYPPYYPLVWAGLVAFGLLLLVVGVRNARGPSDVMHAFWAIAVPAACAGALWYFGWLALLNDVYVRGFVYAIVVASIVRVWLALRGMPGGAQKIVRQQIEQDRVAWRSTRRR